VIRHDDAIHVGVHGRVCVLDRLDALEHHRSVPVLTQERKVGPRAEIARIDLARPRSAKRKRIGSLLVPRRKAFAERLQVERKRRTLVWAYRAEAAAHPLHEDGVGSADLYADARYHGQVGRVEIVRAPAD
jgi:hypothetical protein